CPPPLHHGHATAPSPALPCLHQPGQTAGGGCGGGWGGEVAVPSSSSMRAQETGAAFFSRVRAYAWAAAWRPHKCPQFLDLTAFSRPEMCG
ncbi:unnamed protein product, partial [Urochloa humidicola]